MYFCVFVCSVMCFITKNAIVRVVASQSAKVGLVMCVLSLVTGALWGKPTWGTYFSLDVRMVSMLITLLTNIGYVAIDDIQQKNPNADKILAIFGIFGAINIPIVKFSTEYWNTLHQPASIIRTGGVSISPEFLMPLAIMFAAMVVLCFLLTLCGTATFFIQKKIQRIGVNT